MDKNAQAPVTVVDLETGMFDGRVAPPLHDAEGIVRRVRSILAWARASGRRVASDEGRSQPSGGTDQCPIAPNRTLRYGYRHK